MKFITPFIGALALLGAAQAVESESEMERKTFTQVPKCATGFDTQAGAITENSDGSIEFCYVIGWDLANCPAPGCSSSTCYQHELSHVTIEMGDDFCWDQLAVSSCTATKMGGSTTNSACETVQNDRTTGVSGVKFENDLPSDGDVYTYCFTVDAGGNPLGVGVVDFALKFATYFTLETIAGPVCNTTGVPGSGTGDPHFISFGGEGFDFMGIPNRFYNIFSSYRMNINAHFAKTVAILDEWQGRPVPRQEYVIQDVNFNYLTLMDEIGIQLDDHEIYFAVNGTALLNGVEIAPSKERIDLGRSEWMTFRAVEHGEDIPMNIPDALVEEWYGGQSHNVEFIAHLELELFTLIVKVVRSPHLPGAVFLDINFLPRSEAALRTMNVHGIVGQTAAGTVEERGVESIVVGLDSDYEVEHLFAHDCKHNRFLERQQVEQLFEDLDQNEDGLLSVEELAAWASDKIPVANVRTMVASLDRNNDATLSLQEFFRG